MKLIVGLGNPGATYAAHRHNLGFQVLELLSAKAGIPLAKKQGKALVGKGLFENTEVLLAEPLTWMNLSGEAVSELRRFYKLENTDLVVIHDDIDLGLGQIRWTASSGHGGHNGVRSIIDQLGTQEFYLLRLGVGRPPQGMDPASFVLQNFSKEDLAVVEKMKLDAVTSLQEFLKHGLQWVCQRYH